MRRVAKEKSLQNKETKEKKSHNHPVARFLGKTLLGVAKHTLFASVNDQIERLLFETEDTPNYSIFALLSKGEPGNKSFKQCTMNGILPRYSNAPNEPIDENWIQKLVQTNQEIIEFKENGYKIDKIIGSQDFYSGEREMNEKHAHMVRVNNAIRRKFLPTEEYET